MNIKLKFSLLFIIVIFNLTCNPNINILTEPSQDKLVIWCFLHPDSVVSALISKTSPILKTIADRKITDAKVILYENNISVDTLKYDVNSKYISSKNFKPSENNIYYITIIKEGFLTAQTLPDTMPRKPKLIKYIVNDSVGIEDINSQTYPARLQFFTDQPSNYPCYSFGSHTFKRDVGSGHVVDEYVIIARKNNGCSLDWNFLQYRFNDASCGLPIDYYDFTAENGGRPPKLKNLKVGFTIGAVTYRPQALFKEYYKTFKQPTGDVLDDLFFAPTFFPEYVKNGYGFLGCYNTTEIEVQF